MTQKILIAHPSWTEQQISESIATNGCCAYFVGVPMSLTGISQSQGWSIPCVITEDIETSDIITHQAI